VGVRSGEVRGGRVWVRQRGWVSREGCEAGDVVWVDEVEG